MFYKALSLLVFVLFTLSSSATNFVYSKGPYVKVVKSKQNFVAAEIYFATPEPEDITFQFKLISNSMPSNWNTSLCGYGTCYVGVPGSGEFNKISKSQMENGEEGFFQLMVSPKSFDNGKVQIYVYEKGNFSRGDTITMEVHNVEELASLETIETEKWTMFPNPATSNLTIEIANPGSIQCLQLLDMSGTLVDSYDVIFREQILDLSSLEAGIYLVQLVYEDRVYSKRLVVY